MEILLAVLEECDSIKMYMAAGEHYADVINKDQELKIFEGLYFETE